MYSQNREQQFILDYFGDTIGTFLSVGENDGETLSNVRQLALNGWFGVCVEPEDIAFSKLKKLYEGYGTIDVYKCAIGTTTGVQKFYASGSHLKNGDTGLLSTLKQSEIARWKGTEEFNETEVQVYIWDDFCEISQEEYFSFVSIDAEGYDVDILEQMDLDKMETEMVCIEWNSVPANLKRIQKKLKGWKLIHKNAENLIYVK